MINSTITPDSIRHSTFEIHPSNFASLPSQLFVQKYQLYLPDREELRRELELTLQIAEDRAHTEKD